MEQGFSLQLKKVRFSYPSKSNRHAFSLEIDDFTPGACTAIMGENGSGKTTLGKLLAGILKPTSGSVLYNGENISSWSLGKIGRQIGYLFQEPSKQLFAPYPLEEIAFPLQLRGMQKDEAESKAMELINCFELEGILNNTTYLLSRGEKQRLAIAAAMICKPSFFILDEPTTGLDSRRRNILIHTLQQLMSDKIDILIISHDKSFVKELGADIRYMDGGRLCD